jgi:AmiR/NasT family two-component response regulator
MARDPKYQIAPAPPQLAGAMNSAGAVLKGRRVFLAEDEPMLLWALEEIMTNLGCEVVGTSARVFEAIAFVATHTFDVAVLDGKLADGTIEPVVAVLLARGTPVIIASGSASSECTERFGTVVSIQKPYTDADMRQALILALT